MLKCSMCNMKCNGQKAMDMHIHGKAPQTGELQAMVASVNEQLALHHKFLGASSSRSDSAVYGCQKRA